MKLHGERVGYSLKFHDLSRRHFLGATLALLTPTIAGAANGIAGIEASLGGSIGVSIFNLNTGQSLRYRSNERFAMCSTFKTALAAAIFRSAERRELSLSKRVQLAPHELLPNSPIVAARRSRGYLTLEELCKAAVEWSDNTAANLLLSELGGPAALTRFFRSLGDEVSRLDRMEMDLNSNVPGDPRDTTTPDAMTGSLRAMLVQKGHLGADSRLRLISWMEAEKNGTRRIRAGVPKGWRVANKPGTSINGAVNDTALVWLPSQRPIVMSVFTNSTSASIQDGEKAIAEVARLGCELIGADPRHA